MRLPPPFAVTRAVANRAATRARPYGRGEAAVLDAAAFAGARAEISTWSGYAPTPLLEMPGLAAAFGIGGIALKDESGRFGLGSFKALGGAYAVACILKREVRRATSRDVTTAELLAGTEDAITRNLVVTCATDGNHGRSVAWGAEMFGCGCVIFVHERVSVARVRAIERFGATVVRAPGNYDDAVRTAAAEAERHGRFVVSDTSYPGYTDVPRDVMLGYMVMVDEALDQMRRAPTHIFVQGGVGGLAAAVAARSWQRHGAARPLVICVEPDKADCLLQSAEAGHRVAITGALDTIMAGLACGEVSLLAWTIVQPGIDHFMSLPDAATMEAMRLLADAPAGDAPVVAGDSGAVGLAGLWGVLGDPDLARHLSLGPDSRALVFNSEGDTDPEFYRTVVGRSAAKVRHQGVSAGAAT
ncbi:MAG TPA: diaminopropionate ammonia-lyase [Alphaproteobacteria bacterium]